jgi:HEAT repeat protein
MPQTRSKRLILSVVAALVVLAGFRMVASIPVSQWWHTLSTPSAGNLVKRLQDPDPEVRRRALGQVDYSKLHKADVVAVLGDVAKQAGYPQMQAKAINLLASRQGSYTTQLQEKPTLPQDIIDEVAALILLEQENEVVYALSNFLGNTARWQSGAQQNLVRLSQLLEATEDPAYTSRVLWALKGYAAFHEFPAATWDAVLNVYRHEDFYKWGHPVRDASQVFYAAAHAQHFPDTVREAVEATLRQHRDRDVRRNALFTLSNQAMFTGELSPALEAVLDDADADIRDKAGWAVARFKERQFKDPADKLAALLATARDTELRADVRVKALAEALSPKPGAGPAPETALAVAEEFLRDPQPEIRVGGIIHLNKMSHHAAYQQRLPEIHAWLQQALSDDDASVRVAAVPQLSYVRLDEQQRHDYLVNALKDSDRNVVRAAMDVVGRQKMDSPEIEAALQQLATRQEPALSNTAKTQLRRIEMQRKGPVGNFLDTAKDRKSWGGLLFWAVAALGIGLAAGFAIYYAYRLLDSVSQKSWRALTSFGVLIVWVVATYGMVMTFVFGAFGMGHNSPAPLKDQLTIDALLFAALLIYAGAGWLLHYLVRQPGKSGSESNNRHY